MTVTTAMKFLALVFTALALVPAGAHLFAMPNKIGLPQAEYITVQAIYQGWSLFGIVLVGSVIANLVLAVRVHRDRVAAGFAAAAFLLMAATLMIFVVWVYPANEATVNWTVAPSDWRELRMQWEAAHSVNALITFLAFCLIAVAAIRPTTPR